MAGLTRVLVPGAVVALGLMVAGCGYPPPADPGAASDARNSSSTTMNMGDPSSAPTTVDQMDTAMAGPTKAFPARTAGLGAQLMAPTVLSDGTKEFDLTAAVTPWEVSPGKVVQAWTYNGTVPGPTIRVNVGDKVRIVLTNRLPQSTVLHLHGIRVPNAMDGVPDITQPPIKPGQSFTYAFTANDVAVGMYHSHDFAMHQVSDGLAGAFLVGHEPLPAGVTVTQEVPIMLNDGGVIGLSLNGKSFPATSPITARLGDYLLVDYMNEGQMIHPMHLHGMPQLVIAKDGYALASPQMADTVTVAPGERYTVLVHADMPGIWAWHCHILSHAESDTGMLGMVTALIVT